MNIDFERSWRDRLAKNIKAVAGTAMCEKIMADSETAGSLREAADTITWTAGVMQRMDDLLDTGARIDIMTACSCQYPRGELQEIKNVYRATNDIDRAHGMLRERFIRFLGGTLGLKQDIIDIVLDRGWGLAGVITGNAIIATKIPKSGYLSEYMQEKDPDKKRALYCHCPRIRALFETGDVRLSSTYCYCGGGFYKGIWEEILGHDVRIEMHKSVMQGDDVCQFKVVL